MKAALFCTSRYAGPASHTKLPAPCDTNSLEWAERSMQRTLKQTVSPLPKRPSPYSDRLVSISGVSVAFSVAICGQSEVTACRRRSLRP